MEKCIKQEEKGETRNRGRHCGEKKKKQGSKIK